LLKKFIFQCRGWGGQKGEQTCKTKVYFSVQRMGRTGRKREGRIVVLVTEGAEERKYNTSLLSKKAINKVKNKTGFLIRAGHDG
jgi:hypothetical protein